MMGFKMRQKPTQSKAAGFTLIEMSLTLVVGSIVTLAGLSILALAVRYFSITTRSLQADAELMTALAAVKEHLSQAVDLRGRLIGGGGCINAANLTQNQMLNGTNTRVDGHGQIANCDSTTITPGDGRYLAVFNAELGQVTNRLKGVSIAFIAPGVSQNGVSRSGALYITRVGRTAQLDAASGHYYDLGGNQPLDLRPNDGSIVFTDLVAADVDEVRIRSEGAADQGRVINVNNAGGMAVSAKITLTRRIFMSSELSRRWYCRPTVFVQSPGNCALPPGVTTDQVAKYVDRSRSVTVTFRNNLQLERNVGSAAAVMRKRTFGNIYFFRPISPSF
jgi:prepilin-type N-terminal cleavage/methylation domain-containing protein